MKTADEVIEALLRTCPCASCDRYRKAFARRAAQWAVKLEEAFRLPPKDMR